MYILIVDVSNSENIIEYSVSSLVDIFVRNNVFHRNVLPLPKIYGAKSFTNTLKNIFTMNFFS